MPMEGRGTTASLRAFVRTERRERKELERFHLLQPSLPLTWCELKGDRR